MELLNALPRELHWNVIKYMQHPTASLIETYWKEKGKKRYMTITKTGGYFSSQWKSWV